MSPRTTTEPVSFVDGPIEGVVFKPLVPHADRRGWLAELYREDELPARQHPVMAYVSETMPGVARGPHEHVDQTDYFAFLGPGEFLLVSLGCPARFADPRPPHEGGGGRVEPAVRDRSARRGSRLQERRPGARLGIQRPEPALRRPRQAGPVDEIRHEDQPDSPFRLD